MLSKTSQQNIKTGQYRRARQCNDNNLDKNLDSVDTIDIVDSADTIDIVDSVYNVGKVCQC